MFGHKTRCLTLSVVVVCVAWAVEWNAVVPSARCGSRMIVDTANQRLIAFGGTSVYLDSRYFDDVWEMPLGGPGAYCWHRLIPSGTAPSGRADHAMVYDPVGQRAIVFAGSPAFGTSVNDVWELSLTPGSEAWQQLTVSGSAPSARGYPSAVYYPLHNSLLAFGGSNWGPYYNDVRELSLDSLFWRQLDASGTPPSARCDAAALLDVSENRLLVFGGRDNSDFCNDLWELDLTQGSESWTRLSPSGIVPDRRTGFAHAYDPAAGKLYVFGGWNESEYFDDLYSLDVNATAWAEISPSGELPVERRNTCGAWNPHEGDFFVFGGEPCSGVYLAELHYIHPEGSGTAELDWQHAAVAVPALHIPGVNRGNVRIRYQIPNLAHVRIDILDAAGRVVGELLSGVVHSPVGFVSWDGKCSSGRSAACGSYYCRLTTGATTVTRKFVLSD